MPIHYASEAEFTIYNTIAGLLHSAQWLSTN